MKAIRTIAFLIVFSIRANAQADTASPVAIYGFGNELALTDTVSCFIDSSNLLSLAQVQQHDFHLPFPAFAGRLDEGPSPYAYWIKFGLKNKSARGSQLYLYFGNVDYVDLYVVAAGKPVQLLKGGVLRTPGYDSSYIEKISATLPVYLAAGESGGIYARIVQHTQEYDFSNIQVYDIDNLYITYADNQQSGRYFSFFQLLFQGFLLCQLIYVISQWIIIRRQEYLYYSFYLLMIALYFLSKYENVYGIYFLFSHYPLLSIYLNKTLIVLSYFFYFRFVRSFLEMRMNYPGLNKWVIRIEYFLLGYTVFDLLFVLTTFNIILQRQIYTLVLSVIFIIAASFIIYLFRKKQVLIYYILSGSLFVGLGNVLGLVFTYVHENLHMNLGFTNMLLFGQVGILLEIICFTAGLSYKSKSIEKEKIRNQESLIEQLKANEVLQSKMQSIRNKIAQDLHDDIGSTLSSISILSNLALKEKNENFAFETINEIKDSSMNLMEKMDDIVWSINPRNDSLENLLLRIRRFATTLFEAKNIDYHISIQENINSVKLPMEYRQHVYLILKEAINNMVKYAEAGKAFLEVSYRDDTLEIRVQDNGRGFEMQESFTGNGLLGMKTRAALMQAELDIVSRPQAGTVVVLKIKIK